MPALGQLFLYAVVIDQVDLLFRYNERYDREGRMIGKVKITCRATHDRVAAICTTLLFIFCRFWFTAFFLRAG
jgi:hypothetical protein